MCFGPRGGGTHTFRTRPLEPQVHCDLLVRARCPPKRAPAILLKNHRSGPEINPSIHYLERPKELGGHADSDWAGDRATRKSTNSGNFLQGAHPINPSIYYLERPKELGSHADSD